MKKIPELIELLQSGVHFGHTTSRWHPKMDEYIFGVRQGIHIIDLEKTQEQLVKAMQFITETAAAGKKILWIGTKKQARDLINKYASESNSPYVTDKWLGGTFTNFEAIQHLIDKLEDLEQKRDAGELEQYTKKEQLDFTREIERLEYLVGGIRTMKQLPGAVFMVDAKEDKTARMEATRRGVPIVSLVDTNINPLVIDYPIPANDDAVKSLELFCSLVAEAIAQGVAEFEKNPPQPVKKSTPTETAKKPTKSPVDSRSAKKKPSSSKKSTTEKSADK